MFLILYVWSFLLHKWKIYLYPNIYNMIISIEQYNADDHRILSSRLLSFSKSVRAALRSLQNNLFLFPRYDNPHIKYDANLQVLHNPNDVKLPSPSARIH